MRLSGSCLVCGVILAGLSSCDAAQAGPAEQLPIHVVYVNHVEVESVIDYVPPLVDGVTYVTTQETYTFTSGQLEWEIAQAEAGGGYISFHMSGAYAERAVDAGGQGLWAQHLADGHTVGFHAHSFLRGPSAFQWISRDLDPLDPQYDGLVSQNWQDNYDLVGALVGTEALWIGESHYSCQTCWDNLGYRLKTTEAMAMLPDDQDGQHIVWLVERNPLGTITYPHYPQIGQAGWHGPIDNRIYFDLRVAQLKKEFLMLYLEWLERERLNLEPQVWAWGWCNHGGQNTQTFAAEIQEMLTWLSTEFVGQTSPRGHVIARFVGDHQLSDIYEDYETWGQPLPSPLSNVDDQFPYMADALADAGTTADLSTELGLSSVRLFELERDPPEDPLPPPLPRVYLLFRENDGSGTVDISGVLASRGIIDTTMTLIDVVDGSTTQVDAAGLALGSAPMVLESDYGEAGGDSPFGFHPASVGAPGYPDNGFVDAQYIGVGWHRPPVYAFWFMIQPVLNTPFYDWTLPDSQYTPVPVGINILANIAPQGNGDEGRCLPGTWIPIDVAKYLAFVEATVERYDGDGIGEESFPGGVFPNPIKYWQVGNEPSANATSGFEDLQCITYQAIKSVCPECVVLNGGVAGLGMIAGEDYVANFETVYEPILQGLAGQCVDVFDFHWYGSATGDYRFRNPSGGEDVLAYILGRLAANGFPSEMPIWITEMGSYSGDPPPPFYDPTVDPPPQTERQQASDYFKRFLYSLSRGVQKVFPAFGVIEGFVAGDRNYFDHTGLIYNGIGPEDPDYPDADPDDLGLGVKKLGYYTYKKMTEKLEGADWSTITLLRDGTDADLLYLVRVTKDGQPIHIAWWDYFDELGYTPGDTKDITLTGLTGDEVVVTTVVPTAELGQDVTDYATAFNVTSYSITGGSVTVPLTEDPAIIETGNPAAIPTLSEWGMVSMTLLSLVVGTVVFSEPRPTIHRPTKIRSF